MGGNCVNLRDMGMIDRETVQKILDAADIVEVVGDFVSLKRRGANYIGLCPFHNERTPSFSVSKSKGICKCFSCGKGGSPVNFIMELEQMTYNEALRYLAKKYNIEIKEREMSEQEREEASARESMLAVNEFAMQHFEHVLADTDDGRDIGLAYFRERGINDAMIKRFHLGYSLEQRDNLLQTALRKGYNEKYLIDTGLCYRTERGAVQDRFRGRVIYPVFTVSGKVVAFGGRTLRKDKEVAKYVNSPESLVYRKSYELYGLYQAKQSIVKKDKCILVEGYMDVISMHQSGVENVVASSGTSLTEGQIRLIHRFTENVTVIYDSDAAGIKASMRGIDLLLAEGLNVKVMLLPEGDDPDSFAQSHTSSELEEYLGANEQDFIAFKTHVLMQGVENDPVARSKAIQNIVLSISMIPDQITRTVYIGECSRTLGISEKVLTLQVVKFIADRQEREAADELRRRNRVAAGLPPDPETDVADVAERDDAADATVADTVATDGARAAFLEPYERDVLRYALKYGMVYMCEYPVDDEGNTRVMSVLEYVAHELGVDEISFVIPAYKDAFDMAMSMGRDGWDEAVAQFDAELDVLRRKRMTEGIEEIRLTTDDMGVMEVKEKDLSARIETECAEARMDFCAHYVQKRLLSCDNDVVRRVATDLVSNRHQLSKIHTKFSKIQTEQDRLADLVPLAVYNLKCALVECDIRDVNAQLASANAGGAQDFEEIRRLMQEVMNLNLIKKELAKYLGERILSPRIRRR